MVRPLTSGRKGVVVVGAGDLFPSPSIKELGETGIEGNSGPGGGGAGRRRTLNTGVLFL